jgi:hypothetical protein
MSGKITKPQQSGFNGVNILNFVFLKKGCEVEFSFVETPQQHDFGIDGYLQIFENNQATLNIVPYCQVKTTTENNITFTETDFNNLKECSSLVILFAIFNSFSEKPIVGYYFPQFNDRIMNINKIPNYICCTYDSKKLLLENIKKYQHELNNRILIKQNIKNWEMGTSLKHADLGDGFFAVKNILGDDKVISTAPVKGKIRIEKTKAKEFERLINLKVDKVILDSGITKIDFGKFGEYNKINYNGLDKKSIGGIFKNYIPKSMEITFVRENKILSQIVECYSSIEFNCTIAATPLENFNALFDFEIRVHSDGCYSGLKFYPRFDRMKKLENVAEVYEFFLRNEPIKIFIKTDEIPQSFLGTMNITS